MRSRLAVTALLAACLIAPAANAQQRVQVTFEAFAASGVSGTGSLDANPFGVVQVRATLRGLEPNATYAAVRYDGSASCGAGTSETITTFKANPAGIATWTERVPVELQAFDSIGIRLQSTNVLVACAAVPQ